MPKPKPYSHQDVGRVILERARAKFSMPWKSLEDAFTKMVEIHCCKEKPELPLAVYAFLKKCNPLNPEDQKYALQTLEYLTKHKCWNICTSSASFWSVGEVNVCKTCHQNPGYAIPSYELLHVCKTKEWAVASPNKKPTLRWHMQAQCWIFSYTWHNLVENHLKSIGKDASFDEKNDVWLIADKVIGTTFRYLHQWMPDIVWLKTTKREIPASRAQVSQQALFAETILSFLPQSELKALTRKAFMNLHPDKGGNKDDFIKFKLALEGWEKGRSNV